MKTQERHSRTPQQASTRAGGRVRPKVETRRVVKEQRQRSLIAFLVFSLKTCSLLSVCCLCWVLFRAGQDRLVASDNFKIVGVEVVHSDKLSRESILNIAGIHEGDSIFVLDEEAACKRLESVPGIKKAEVERLYPDRVRILVEERKDAALLARGRLYVLDEDGMIIRPFDLKDPWPGPVISGLSMKDISFGKPVADPRMDDAVSLLRSLRTRHEGLLSSISEIHFDSLGGASLILSDTGISIRLRDDDWEWKLSCIQPVLDAEQASGRMPQVAYVDFCGQKAFVGYRSPSPGAGQVS